MLEALTLDPGVERDHVDPAGVALVRGAGDLAGQFLLAGVRRHADDLPGLDVRPEAHDEVCQAAAQVGVVEHRRGA